MAILRINDRDLLVKNLSTSKIMHIQELQRQSGLKLAEINASVIETDVLGMVVLSFLTQRTAGIPVRWDDLYDGTPEELGLYIPEPGDPKPEAQEVADPPVSSTSGSEDDGKHPEIPPATS